MIYNYTVKVRPLRTLIASFLLTFSGCGANASNYERSMIDDIVVCDLKQIGTFDFLRITPDKRSLIELKKSAEEQGWNAEIRSKDINITHCRHDRHPYYSKEALRIRVSMADWIDGYDLAYDLYFDEKDQLKAVEARHLYVGKLNKR